MDMQLFINGLASQWQKERAETQLTLKGLINRLSELNQDLEVDGINQAHSYRGYYHDLAFELSGTKRKVSDILADVIACKGETFVGYKGGDFDMTNNTPVWIAEYGDIGMKIISVTDNGEFITEEDK